jgi:rubrerythrin
MHEILRQQRNEITEYEIYRRLADMVEDENNRKLLLEIAEQERNHYVFWSKVTGKEVELLDLSALQELTDGMSTPFHSRKQR